MNHLQEFIKQILFEELSSYSFAPKFGDIDPTDEEDKDRPGMEDRPKDPMDISQFKKLMWAESDEHQNEEEKESKEGEETVDEACAISGGGAGLASTGQVSATSGGSGWTDHKPEHDLMWSGDDETPKKKV